MAKPTEVFDNYWIYFNGLVYCSPKGLTLGKWLIFKDISCIDQVWETISHTVLSGELGATSSNPNIKVISILQQKIEMRLECS